MSPATQHSGPPASVGASPYKSSFSHHVHVFLVGGLLITAFWAILIGMYGSWFDERSYMEHGIFVIPAAAYMVWTKRPILAKIRCKPSVWGVPLLLWGAAQAILAQAAHATWLSRTAFLVGLVGCIVSMYGFQMARVLAFPLGTLILMIAPPTFVYERLTLDLQLLASRIGESCLEAMGYSVMREGNVLELVGMKLSIEEACSGLHSLLSILFMCVLYNYFFVRGNLVRTLILGVAVPIAILGNAGRVVATGIASRYNRELIHGPYHEAFGYIAIVVAAAGCILVHILTIYIQKLWHSRHADYRKLA